MGLDRVEDRISDVLVISAEILAALHSLEKDGDVWRHVNEIEGIRRRRRNCLRGDPPLQSCLNLCVRHLAPRSDDGAGLAIGDVYGRDAPAVADDRRLRAVFLKRLHERTGEKEVEEAVQSGLDGCAAGLRPESAPENQNDLDRSENGSAVIGEVRRTGRCKNEGSAATAGDLGHRRDDMIDQRNDCPGISHWRLNVRSDGNACKS